MHVRLEIEADCAADLQREVARLFPASIPVLRRLTDEEERNLAKVAPADVVRLPEPEVQEAAPEAESPKPRARGKTKKAGADTATDQAGSTASPTSDTATAGKTEGTSTSEVTLDDIRSKASALMDAGKHSGADIQAMLVSKFNARAFGQLKPEQYADVIGELNNLG
jgi:hypothetical protein